jgi:hypothetical protein
MYLMMKWAFEAGYRRYEWKCNALNSASPIDGLGGYRLSQVYRRCRQTLHVPPIRRFSRFAGVCGPVSDYRHPCIELTVHKSGRSSRLAVKGSSLCGGYL